MRRSRLALTGLAVTLGLLAGSAAVATATTATTFKLDGTLTGQWRAVHSVGDSGVKYRLGNASGHTSAGASLLSATSSSLGFVRASNCEADTTLITTYGTMSVRLRSKTTYNGGFSCKRYPFYFRIDSGTDHFANYTGSGTGWIEMTGSDVGDFTIHFTS